MKWTKKSIDNFYLENKVILTINNDLINHREIKKLGNKYYNWYQAIVRDYNDSYENVEDFRITH